LGRKISYKRENDIENKVYTNSGNAEQYSETKFSPRKFRLELYTILANPTVLYDCEMWTLKKQQYKKTKHRRDGNHETHSSIQFTGPHKKNEDILEEFKAGPAENKLAQYEGVSRSFRTDSLTK